MEISEGVKRLNALIGNTDYETVHCDADNIILEFLPKEIREEYDKVVDQARWWAYA